MPDTPQSTGPIPDDLLRNIQKGDCVLFFGDDFGPLPTGDTPPGRAAFTARLAAKLPPEARNPRTATGVSPGSTRRCTVATA